MTPTAPFTWKVNMPIKEIQRMLLSFWCPACQRWIPCGNLGRCQGGEHEGGIPTFPDWDKELPADGLKDVLIALGYKELAREYFNLHSGDVA